MTSFAAHPAHGGGALVDLLVRDEAEKARLAAACDLAVELNERQLCDVELLIQGGFSPLEGFMDEANYHSVVASMRLTNGTLFALPIVFDTNDDACAVGKKVLLQHAGVNIALLDVSSKWRPNKALEAKHCYASTSIEHPAVHMIATEREHFYCGGKVTGLNIPQREFPCRSPAEVRAEIPGDVDIVAFQCRNPLHKAHVELIMRAIQDPSLKPNSVVLVHPTCGPTQEGDIPGDVRYKTYLALQKHLDAKKFIFEYLPYNMHMAGPREAIQHMIIRKNYGCTHFIIGRDMAGCKSTLTGEDFYGPFESQEVATTHAAELGIAPMPSANVVYTEERGFVLADEAKEHKLTIHKLSGTKFREMLRSGEAIPSWFAFEYVVDVLREEAQGH